MNPTDRDRLFVERLAQFERSGAVIFPWILSPEEKQRVYNVWSEKRFSLSEEKDEPNRP